LSFLNRRWQLAARLGSSGEARAFAAVEASSGRRAVLKVAAVHDDAARARLLAEFERLAALDDPGLPEVFELGVVEDAASVAGEVIDAGAVFIAMERIVGHDAIAACAGGSRDERARTVAAIVADVAEALGALHEAGLIHHDLKPVHFVGSTADRFRLIDLGLVRAGGGDGSARGTLAYLSIDALVGASDPAVDLYALGVSAYELLAGRLPYEATSPAGLLAAMATPPPPPPGPKSLVALVRALMSRDAADRPSRAFAVAEELARTGLLDEPRAARIRARGRWNGVRLGRPGFVASAGGRGAALAQLDAALQRGTPVVLLVGESGSGRSRLVAELERRRALSAIASGRPRPKLFGPELTDVARALDLRDALARSLAVPAERAARARSAFLTRMLSAAHEAGAILHFGAPEPALAHALAGLAARSHEGAQLILEVDPTQAAALARALGPEDFARVLVPELDGDEIALLCMRLIGASSPALNRVAGRLSRGRPRALIHLVAAAQARGGAITPASLRAVRLDALDDELAALVRSLPAPAPALLVALSLLERPASAAELGAAVGDATGLLAELEAGRLVDRNPQGAYLIESEAVAGAAWAASTAKVRRQIGARLVKSADARGDLLPAALLAHRIGLPDAVARARGALTGLLGGEHVGAAENALADERVQQLARSVPGGQGELFMGQLALRNARYDEAATRLASAARTLPAARRASARLGQAQALRLADHRDEAERVARTILHAVNGVGTRASLLLARLALDRGDASGARDQLRELVTPDLGIAAERDELEGLAALASGDGAGARIAFERLADAQRDAEPARRARVAGLLGIAAQSEGALEVAAAAYQAALTDAEAGFDPHGAAIYAQNLGGTWRELGELARALAPLERAVEVLRDIGRADEEAMARFNLGNLQLSLGDFDAAEAQATAALERVGAERGRAAFYCELLLGDLERRRGLHARAIARYEALQGAPHGPDGDEQTIVACALAEAAIEAGDTGRARRALDALLALPEPTPAIAAHRALSEARVRLALDEAQPLSEALREKLIRDGEAAESSARRDRGMRLAIVLARDALRRRDVPLARERLDLAERQLQEILMRTPELRRAALADDPDVRLLRALHEAATAPSESDPARRLLEINKRLNSELNLDRLLELILDTVLDLTRAERGFLLVRSAGGTFEVRCERNIDAAERSGAAAFSRSIAERATSLGESIVTVDAAGDTRFEAALSVTDLRLRSVLAVPLSIKGRAVGCVYVDHRARIGLFRPSDVALVTDLAEQAAIAVENARLLADNRHKTDEVRALNDALEQRLAVQTVELDGLHREVREARDKLGVRYDYSNLIGQTPRMLELFRLLDRVTDTALPVVIYGESGTGKELVARALHHNGPRRKAAFVSESCAAIPETLLEAALFGHARGAFTGAQGERRGLFEIADHGTLFLDEVGEMSPAMQVRLLRVLQEGEFRRVGGEKQLKVDVRIIVASNSDLGRLVEQGRFREDLFYRLNVVRVALPALRERLDDISLLVEHFLAQHDGVKITRRALDRLRQHRWPGNVRQLENEIARAASLASGTIDLADLSPTALAGSAEAEPVGVDALDLHGRVERLERSLLVEALQRSAGNQSEAARLLGLSRFGLQKKLRRYQLPARAE
jgi:transcriptional regulator with GAF, ATPase, and Fis domain